MTNSLPRSRKIFECDSSNYWITAASWDSGYGDSYEIGIREKEGRMKFYLIQNGRWNERSIVKVAGAIKTLLDHGLTPTELSNEVLVS